MKIRRNRIYHSRSLSPDFQIEQKEGSYVLQKDELHDMRIRLERIARSGAVLYLEGREVSAEELVCTCFVNEETVYMPDYVMNQEGKLTELRYDRIRQT